MNEQAIKEIIERQLRLNVKCVDLEFVREANIPDSITVDPSWLANKIMKNIKDSGELRNSKEARRENEASKKIIREGDIS